MANPRANTANLQAEVSRLDVRTNLLKCIGSVVAAVLLALFSYLLHLVNADHDLLLKLQQAFSDSAVKTVSDLLEKPPVSRQQAEKTLSAAALILSHAKPTGQPPSQAPLRSAEKAITGAQELFPDLPSVWQATSSFISYKSEALLGPSPEAARARSKPCKFDLGFNGLTFSNCNISLEDLAQRFRGIIVNGAPAPFTFNECFVRYQGGPLPPTQLNFKHCILDFRTEGVPTPEGMLAMKQLTTAGLDAQVKM